MSRKAKISVWIKLPGMKPEKRIVENTLESFQNIVGGYIEVVTLTGGKDAIVCNEEGRIQGLAPNCVIANAAIHGFVGTIAMVGIDGEEFADATHDLCSFGPPYARCFIV